MPSIFDELPGFLELGAWTTRHIRPLFELFRDEDVAPALALIIFGSALVLCFLFIIDSSFIRMQVRRRIRAVRSIRGKVEFAEATRRADRVHAGRCVPLLHGQRARCFGGRALPAQEIRAG